MFFFVSFILFWTELDMLHSCMLLEVIILFYLATPRRSRSDVAG